MKTTIEIKGYEIVIEETEEGVTVMAIQDGETVEEFTLDGEVEVQDDDMKSFGDDEDEVDDFDDADEYEDEMDELGQDEDDEDDDDDFGGDDEGVGEEEEEAQSAPKMESFGSFVRRKQNFASARRR